MPTYFKHDISPEIGNFFGFTVYWYGAVYSIGFLGIFAWLLIRRSSIGLGKRDVYELTILVAIGILIGGRMFDILVYELDYYRLHPLDGLNWWKGGLASHGVLLGSAASLFLYCRLRDKPFLRIADELVVPAAFLLAAGRLGNFIEGGVIGSRTMVPWAVLYDSVDGPRHPVALYESAKNLFIVPVLIWILGKYPAGKGVSLSVFILLYALLRFVVDQFRDYESYWWGLDKGQFFNLAMAIAGTIMLVHFMRTQVDVRPQSRPSEQLDSRPVGIVYRMLLAFLVIYPLGIPTSWTQVNIEEQRRQSRDLQ